MYLIGILEVNLTAQTTQELRSGFAIIGDTQRTMAYQIILGKEVNNHAERVQIIAHIKLKKPDFLLNAGDMVTYGHSKKDWAYFESIMEPLGSTPMLPVVGNHDYFFQKDKARALLKKKFPRLTKETWYVEKWGPLAIVVLDSNKQILKDRWSDQIRWLIETMAILQDDPEVKGIIVAGHHPPYTNSLEISPHSPTLTDLVPLVSRSKKVMAYISGHCHAYERFEEQGKTFIVSGGGGGPRQSLRTGVLARNRDLYDGGRIRPFHYLWFTLSNEGLLVEVNGLEKGQSKLTMLESFTLRWANEMAI